MARQTNPIIAVSGLNMRVESKYKAHVGTQDCFPCLRKGKRAALLAMTETPEELVVQTKPICESPNQL